MKLHIAVCDDEKAETEALSEVLRSWAVYGKHSVRLSVFDSAEAFLFAYEADKTIDILLLDIQMKGLDGVSLAKKLRSDGSRTQIIFITGYPDFIAEGYEVSALHYLMKPVDEQKLREVLKKAASRLSERRASILLTADGGSRRVFVDVIRCIEVLNHELTVDTGDGLFHTRMSLAQLLSELDNTFFRCHRSYIVGVRHVSRVSKTEVLLDDGKSIPLSRRLYSDMNQAFIQYYKGEL